MVVHHVSDRIEVASVDEWHLFREKKYPFTYLCKNCQRGFDSEISLEKCKFCNSENIIQLQERIRVGKDGKKMKYRHYCTTCERNFISEEKLTVCNNCRTDYVHVYTWENLSRREKLYINMQKAAKLLLEKKPVQEKKSKPLFNFRSSREELPSY